MLQFCLFNQWLFQLVKDHAHSSQTISDFSHCTTYGSNQTMVLMAELVKEWPRGHPSAYQLRPTSHISFPIFRLYQKARDDKTDPLPVVVLEHSYAVFNDEEKVNPAKRHQSFQHRIILFQEALHHSSMPVKMLVLVQVFRTLMVTVVVGPL